MASITMLVTGVFLRAAFDLALVLSGLAPFALVGFLVNACRSRLRAASFIEAFALHRFPPPANQLAHDGFCLRIGSPTARPGREKVGAKIYRDANR